MGVFQDLMNKIFHPATGSSTASGGTSEPSAQASSPQATASASTTTTQRMAEVDVAAILDKMASENKQKLDWKHSIVDLMKLVGMDSSLAARRELAADLDYSGDTKDTAAMNIWLHKEVMRKLAENGGKIPPELLAA